MEPECASTSPPFSTEEWPATDYERIATAIRFIVDNQALQPTLDQVADSVDLSSFYFQRLFSKWAGVTPKRFLQILTVQRAKELLLEGAQALQTTHAVGLSSSSRLHEHFVRLEAVTPGEYKLRGQGVTIHYGTVPTPFGEAFLAATDRGICRFSFLGEKGCLGELAEVRRVWPRCELEERTGFVAALVAKMFCRRPSAGNPLSLHVSGTNFQVNVWRALLRIPPGRLTTYQQIGEQLGGGNLARAVGGAVGANPVAFVIPCHRVIRRDGGLGGYRWGDVRKHALHAWESANDE